MKKLLITLAMLAPMAALAANITGTEGDDVINGTAGDDIINALGGNDKVQPQCGTDVVNLGSGNNFLFSICGSKDIVAGIGNNEVYLAGLGTTHSVTLGEGSNRVQFFDPFGIPAAVTVTTGGGNDIISCPTSVCTVNAGDGNNEVYGGQRLTPIDPATIIIDITTGSGNDIVWGGGGDDMLDAGGGDDLLDTLVGQQILMGGSGNDTILFGVGDAIAYGEAGSDTFRIRSEAVEGGNKEVVDFKAADYADFRPLPISKEQAINSIVIVQPSGAPFSFNLVPSAQAGDRKEAAKAYREARKARKLRTVWKPTTWRAFDDRNQSNLPSVKDSWARLVKECKARTKKQSSLGLVGDANANPNAGPGDIIFQGGMASLLIKDGVALIANGEITPDNILTQF